MEQGKNKNGVIILLVVLVVILAALCVLFATGTIKLKSDETTNNPSSENTNTQQKTETNESDYSFGGEYVHNLANGAKLYTDYTTNGSFYYKRIESDNSVSTYGYGIYKIDGDVLTTKIVFGIDTNKKSVVKSVVPESKYRISTNSIEYDATGTSGQNYTEEKISNNCDIINEVISYLYEISKNNEYNNNFKYE